MIAMPETTLDDNTYPEKGKGNIFDFSTSSEVVECYLLENVEVEYTKTLNTQTYPDELAGFSEEAKERLFHSLKQTKTKSLGSFVKYINSSDE